MKYRGWIPDFKERCFVYSDIITEGKVIAEIKHIEGDRRLFQKGDIYILPGLVDSHVHIESSMLIPSEFAVNVVKYGTVATVSDPHEIANVLGEEGISYMFQDAAGTPVKIHFTAPSCVPATAMEKSGAVLDADDLKRMASIYDFTALGEMMNFPGVVNMDKEVYRKIEVFRRMGKPVDGHAPGLVGEDLEKYIGAGISTDHEATDLNEAREKIRRGMKIQIREGSAAKNFDALWPLIAEYPDRVMLCCDDIHPDELLDHHLDKMIIKGLKNGLEIFDLLKAASINAAEHYKLDVGRLRVGDRADFILVEDLQTFRIKETVIDGKIIFRRGRGINIPKVKKPAPPNIFNRGKVRAADFETRGESGIYRIIGAIDGDLFTSCEKHYLKSHNGVLSPDIERDIIKIAVVSRYDNSSPALGWIKNTGLIKGALASSIAHDSHNIIVMGITGREMAEAVNLLVENQGGISIWSDEKSEVLPLPVAGLMSTGSAGEVGRMYSRLNKLAMENGSRLGAPFMTLSFMALLVIPELKIGDRGLFDVKEFKFVEAKEEAEE
jgi:adenine deaminase